MIQEYHINTNAGTKIYFDVEFYKIAELCVQKNKQNFNSANTLVTFRAAFSHSVYMNYKQIFYNNTYLTYFIM